MRTKNGSKWQVFLTIIISVLVMLLFGGRSASHQPVQARRTADAYDLSEWQGRLTNHRAHRLKHEVSFMILRAQNGSHRQDRTFSYNARKLRKAKVPYGAYSFSLYHNSASARNEARTLYQRAPEAKFYVNDVEINHAGRDSNRAGKAWAHEMKRLTQRPVVLYSYANFINQHLRKARKAYNTIWLAGYTSRQPLTHFKYGMWQFTNNYYSRALGKRIDASRLTGQPLTFWIGNRGKPVSANNTPKSSSGMAPASLKISRADRGVVHRAEKHLRSGHRLTRHEKKMVKKYHLAV